MAPGSYQVLLQQPQPVQGDRNGVPFENQVALEPFSDLFQLARLVDEAIPLLHRALSPQLESLIYEEILRLDIRTPRQEVLREVAPILAQMEEEESHARADQLVDAVREQGLGVIGLEETRHALDRVEGEVLAQEAPLNEQERNDLVRLVTLSDAEVDLVKGHEILQHLGGVVALLRYRLRWV